jgi:hypothetical protein
MTRRSLFFGALALLALLAFAGCSNPAGDPEYVTQVTSEYPFPADTVFTSDYLAFVGLLNDYEAGTNGVRNIAYEGSTIPGDTIIPKDKTVYLTNNFTSSTGNIIVQDGAKLILVGNFTAGNTGLLLVRGQVEVFGSLKVTNNALDVRDYTDENDVEDGRNTVIGSKVTVLPGATLTLDVTDLIPVQPVYVANKFTPAEAWTAAGQGNLVIGTSGTPKNPDNTPSATYNYTVEELLKGVEPNAKRSYTVSSQGKAGEVLPALIPAGAYIRTGSSPAGSEDNTLTVNGGLWVGGSLEDITEITLGNGGSLELTQGTGDVLPGLESLTVGAAASFGITSTTTTLKALNSLVLKDGGSVAVPGGTVTFNPAAEAALALTLGKGVMYNVGTAPTAVVNATFDADASLLAGSVLTVNKGSTFTVAAGKILTIEDGAILNLLETLTEDTGISTPPVQINGTILVAEDGTIAFPDPTAFTASGDNSTIIGYGTTGKVVLQKGAIAKLGETTYVDDADGNTPTFKMAADSVIEISTHLWKISGGNVGLELDATIIAADTLDIAAGATLTVKGTKKLTLKADGADKGAKLTGAGAVKADVTLISGGGGTSGWQALGTGGIAIGADTNVSTITADAATVSLTALGSATITQVGGANNNLTINGTSSLSTAGVINLSTGGAIILPVANTAAKLTLGEYCLIKIGGGEATASVTADTNMKAALKDGTNSSVVGTGLTGKAFATGASVLTQIIGSDSNNTVTGPTSGTENIVITANMPATGS